MKRLTLPILVLSVFLNWLTPAVQADDFQIQCGFLGPLNLTFSIKNANESSGQDTIHLTDNCIYNFTFAEDGRNALPVITDDLIIEGNGATIQRDSNTENEFRLIAITDQANVVLRNVNVTRGKISDGGAGILVSGNLILENVQINSNLSQSIGGAISVVKGTLTILNSKINDNVGGLGGGISVIEGTVILQDSQLLVTA